MRFFLLISGLFFVVGIHAQGPRIPEDIRLDTEEEYLEYRSLAVNCMSWLINSPKDEFLEKRMETTAFVMLWLAGTPTVTVTIDSKAMPFLEEDDSLLFPFIYGVALYQMNHVMEHDKVVLHAQGLRAVALVCEKCDCGNRSKVVKKIRKAYKKDNLLLLASEWLGQKK